jgi:glycosyltransferase involved in cell wall biosynthesis
VLQVVTLMSPDGAFGGPTRVAEQQSRALLERGHEVMIAAGSRGYGATTPTELGGVRLRLFPVRPLVPGAGFSGLASGPMFRWLRRAVREVDVVHVHLGRDLVTLTAASLARRAGAPYVVQTHGMVTPSAHPLARPLDHAMTLRVLRDAAVVLYLTDVERDQLLALAGSLPRLAQLGNGIGAAPAAHALPARPEVLFCARLQARKRPMLFVRMAERLLAAGVDADFVLVGPDEGEGGAVADAIAGIGDARLRWEGAMDPSRTLGRMGRASMLVLPSVQEPYPMSVLEAMSIGRAVVVTATCGLAPAVKQTGSGAVVGESVDELVGAVGVLLADPTALREAGDRAFSTARERFGLDSIAARLEGHYLTASSEVAAE